MFEFDKYCLEGEIWKDVPGYEGLYQASSLGRIRTVDGKITYSIKHGERKWKGIILRNKTKSPNNSGYKVDLWKDKKPEYLLVARLVCSTFYGKPDDLYYGKSGVNSHKFTVNHKDGDRFNNRIENLEWLTLRENIQHGFKNGLYPTHGIILKEKNGKIHKFESKAQASKFLTRNNGYISGRIKKKKNVGKNISNEQYMIYEI